MLNYLSAEWYKLRHTRGIFVSIGVLLALVVLLFLPGWSARQGQLIYEIYSMTYLIFLPVGFFLAPIFAVRAFDDQYGRGTLKNEIVFGIHRSRIYLGKLAFGALAGTAAALVVLGVYLLLCILVAGPGTGNGPLYLNLCVQSTVLVWPLWMASLSLAFCLQVVFKSSAGAAVADYLILLVGVPIALIGMEGPTGSWVLDQINRWFFAAPFRELYQASYVLEDGGRFFLEDSWLLGLGWVVVTSLVGQAAFSRKEIR